MRHRDRRRALRAALAGPAVVRPASVFDAMSARIAEDMGFEAIMLGGSVASLAVLGAPDVAVLTLTELAEQVRRICRAGSLPLMVDADHGFGNALSVRRTVEELETAGAAALSIEDTALPRPFGPAGTTLVPLAEGRAKMLAALDARADPDLVIVGRTSVHLVDEAEGLARIRAYQETGIDALCLIGVRSRRQLDALASIVTCPIVLSGVRGELDDSDYLASRGVRLCIPVHTPFAAAMRAVHDALAAARPGAAAWMGETAALVRRASREDVYDEWDRRFLGDGT
jgi:carboxyvinyl-carboxyphosphonate phosphorylmutase